MLYQVKFEFRGRFRPQGLQTVLMELAPERKIAEAWERLYRMYGDDVAAVVDVAGVSSFVGVEVTE